MPQWLSYPLAWIQVVRGSESSSACWASGGGNCFRGAERQAFSIPAERASKSLVSARLSATSIRIRPVCQGATRRLSPCVKRHGVGKLAYSPLPITLNADAAKRAAKSGSKPSCGYARTGTERRRSVSRSAIRDLSRKRHGRSITDSESRCESRGQRSERLRARFPVPESRVNSAVGRTTSVCKARLSRTTPKACAGCIRNCRLPRGPTSCRAWTGRDAGQRSADASALAPSPHYS